MILYRITSKVHARDLSGTGAFLYGGRWNSKGVRMVYTSGSLSLAALEVIANLSGDKLNKNLYCVELEFPDHLPVQTLDPLPEKWNEFPYSGNSVNAGNSFIKEGGFCLKVPSAIIPSEYNYLLNPLHNDFAHVKFIDARPLILDKRLFN
ncbi:MAG: RES family NAD+ phosphorylase [Bacteroidota bacterium]